MCPRDIAPSMARAMLRRALRSPNGRRLYATDGGRAYCGAEHAPGEYHGFPVGWREVPPTITSAWVDQGLIKRRDVRRYWTSHDDR